jgi:tRNA pseudouridine38-40 synthase
MRRFKLTVEYDGSGLVGWQRQDNGPSVQALMEAAAEKLCGAFAEVTAAGRTDAGVHATGQIVHLDMDRALSPESVRDGLNFWLRGEAGWAPVSILEAEVVDDSFHARFSATGRRYLYRIVNRRPPLVLARDRAWWVPQPLDAGAMLAAAQRLVGHHDFSTFRAAECQAASPVKTLDRLDVERDGEEIRIIAAARSFLHHQVRNMVGTLKLVGEGKWSAADVTRALEAHDRRQGGPTAPACGLYLIAVEYGEPRAPT